MWPFPHFFFFTCFPNFFFYFFYIVDSFFSMRLFWQHMWLLWRFDPVTSPFCHETVSCTSGLSSAQKPQRQQGINVFTLAGQTLFKSPGVSRESWGKPKLSHQAEHTQIIKFLFLQQTVIPCSVRQNWTEGKAEELLCLTCVSGVCLRGGENLHCAAL